MEQLKPTTLGEVSADEKHKIPQELLVAIFKDQRFNANLIEACRYTHRNKAETGFIVEAANGQPVISKLLKSPRLASIENLGAAWGTDFPKLTHLKNPDYKRLERELVLKLEKGKNVDSLEEQIEQTEKIIPKKEGIILRLHTHPVIREERPVDLLAPSGKDLENWEDIRSNIPFIINAIMTTDGTTAYLLFFQADPNSPQNTFYQGWDEYSPATRLLELMRESGIRYEKLDIKLKDGGLTEDDIEKLARRFTVVQEPPVQEPPRR